MALDAEALRICGTVVNPYGYQNSTKDLETLVTSFVSSTGITFRVTSRRRTCYEQLELYRAGRTTAAPGTSQHEWGLAFDLVPTGGYSRYGASFAEVVQWFVLLSRFYGGDGLAESDHAHLTVYSNEAWRAFLLARDIGISLPIPGRRR